MPAERGKNVAGFTLVELLVVLAILALVTGLVVPRLGRSMQTAALDGAVAEIEAALRTASGLAIADDRSVVFRADSAGSGYWIGNQYHPVAAADRQMAMTIAGRVTFFPWGGSSGGRVRVAIPQGRRDIIVDAVTGRGAVRR
ncbi:MAG TPA: prepilin-type N-terminal cleavage/methylation domain-containing protein [Stellaceae bacterium]|nr:prepilin-type N-terminal cleavage/methylation domain-containing protein [Stellaceae bacterium]